MGYFISICSLFVATVGCIISFMSYHQNAELNYSQSRAVLLAEFRHRTHHKYLFIKNFGKSPARIHRIGIIPEFTREELGDAFDLYGANPFSALANSYFMPGECKWIELPFTPNAAKEYTFIFYYSDIRRHLEMQTISAMSSSPYSRSVPLFDNDSKAIHHIGQSLDEIVQYIWFHD